MTAPSINLHPAIKAGLNQSQRRAFEYFCCGGSGKWFAPYTIEKLLDTGLIVKRAAFQPAHYAVPKKVHDEWVRFVTACNDYHLETNK